MTARRSVRFNGMRRAVILSACALISRTTEFSRPGEALASGKRQEWTIHVSVPADPLKGRNRDSRPAEYRIQNTELPAGSRIDLSSLQVTPLASPSSHSAIEGKHQVPLPLRWYDDAIPYDFPECEQNVHSTDGVHLAYQRRPRWGEFYNLGGNGRGGRLVWLHTQEGNRPTYYTIQFRTVDASSPASLRDPLLARAPRDLVGDGSPRCEPKGTSTTDMIHSRVTVVDFDGDGMLDLLVGGAQGAVLAYRNTGTAQKPAFPTAELVFTTDGKPLDVGWSAAPLAVDWDCDGRFDLLCGAERNRILYYRNVGPVEGASGSRLPRFHLQGFVKADGKPIELPTKPVPEGNGVFDLDYYPVLDAPDWNGDGLRDLLAGGFITGRVYYYQCTRRNPDDGTPVLAFRGPVLAHGEPLDVGWAAAPCAADFDGDGDLDLVCGCMLMSSSGGDQSAGAKFLRYYENIGNRNIPRLVERPFPRSGSFPDTILGTPRAVDINGDGLLDLVVSASTQVFIYLNIGTKTQPRFKVDNVPLPSGWGNSPLPTYGVQFLDENGDGRTDILVGLNIYRAHNSGRFIPFPLLASNNKIDHPARSGDGWMFTQLADLDGDGKLDLLYGTHSGHIFFHRRQGSRFDEAGVLLLQTDGKPVHVGPMGGQVMDFDVLQGARTAFCAADFDRDGRIDLAVGDTYGKVRYFRNMGTLQAARYAPALDLGDMRIRAVPCASDWDGDGRLDVIASAASGDVALFRNLGNGRFATAQKLSIPPTPYSPVVTVTDWNGDGDEDVIVGTSYGFFCWFERSFLDGGYAIARKTRQTVR